MKDPIRHPFAFALSGAGARRRLPALAAVLACACSWPAGAQQQASYPNKPVRLVVPFAPGGAVDILARVLGQKLTEQWGQTVVVDNKGGANGIIAAEAVAHSPPDGYALLLGTNGTHATNAALYPTLPYDPVGNFAPVMLLASIPHVITVNPTVPVNNLQEFVALAKDRELRYGSAGNGSSLHLSGELFKQATGARLLHVPYKGGAPAVTDLLAGRIDAMFAVAPLVIPQINAGQLKALAIMADRRSALLPNVPTTAEAGLPDLASTAWIGLLAPAGTPRAVIDRLNQSITAAWRAPQVQTQLAKQGFDLEGGTPEAFGQFIASETAKWTRVVVKSGAKLD